jgi:hypothetical protein
MEMSQEFKDRFDRDFATTGSTPTGVLKSIARICCCAYDDIESTLEKINDTAGFAPRPIARKGIAAERLDTIRLWLSTPEAHSIIDQANEYVRRLRN